jgi:hypothetical protein
VTFDQFQSTDSQQILRQWGLSTGHQSIDEVPCRPYDFTKAAMYDERIMIPTHKKLQTEIVMLEKDSKTGKIDHPPTGSKDCSDALAGVVYGLTMRREMWAHYRIPLISVPNSVINASDKLTTKSEGQQNRDYQQEFVGS